jgi:hypothetical protein
MIAPGSDHGKSLILATSAVETGKTAARADHELVKSPHNNALFSSIVGHAELG